MSELIFTRAPVGLSLQDAGRKGHLREGISAAGPMDWARHAMVNQMLHKPLGATALEIGPAGMGMTLESGELQISFAGPRFTLYIDGMACVNPVRTILNAGQQLQVKPRKGAMWAYLGIQGQFMAPPLLGSQAENSVSGMRAVQLNQGSRLLIEIYTPEYPVKQAYIDPYIAYQLGPIGIVPSSQFDDFSDHIKARMTAEPWMISARYDRMAYRLQGAAIVCDKGHDILSDAVTMGAIQVPGNGQPFILMADHQSTGGYPKIACVCKADLPRLAQMSPNILFMLAWQNIDEALDRWSEINQQISNLTALSGLDILS